ncbi:MAG TPA: hypothetical protein VGO97_04605 [Solirubrobacterales bacterium]|jgi:hypothetical protein|nr:hypothetical protein [Solirubrobacterales bacterium]
MRVRTEDVDIGLRLMDHQLLDALEIRCGKVDDLELAEDEHGLYVSALLSGPRAQSRRGGSILRRAIGWIGRDVEHRVEWSHVRTVATTVELRGEAEDYGLGEGDRLLKPLIEKLIRR